MNNDQDLAARYFNEHIGSDLQRDGMPEEGVVYLRQRYVAAATQNPEAVRHLRELYGETPAGHLTAEATALDVA